VVLNSDVFGFRTVTVTNGIVAPLINQPI